jgi:hypothetical protein
VVGLIVVVFGGIFVIGIIAGIAIPALMRARMSANEAAAIGTMRIMVSAQTAWSATHDGRYVSAACLMVPAICGDAQSSSFLTPEIGSLRPRSGYDFGLVLRPGAAEAAVDDGTGDGTPVTAAPADLAGFVYWAWPSNPGVTGVRRFCVDETGVVREYGADAAWRAPTADHPRCPDTGRPVH